LLADERRPITESHHVNALGGAPKVHSEATMASHSRNSPSLILTVLTLSTADLSFPAAADDVPESLRLEQKAKKAYSQKPVVPIDRGNAHHRDIGGSTGDGVTPDRMSPALPNPTVQPSVQSDPKSTQPK
jgi:hypothetical protein